MNVQTCPMCGQPLPAGAELGGDQAHEHELDALPLSAKLERLRSYLLEGQPAVAGGFGSGLAIIRVVHRMGVLRPLYGNLPPLEDEGAWLSLLTLVVGVLSALAGEQIDHAAARQLGLALLGEVIPPEPDPDPPAEDGG